MKLSLSLCAFIVLGAACASDTDDRPRDFNYIHAAIIKPNCATSGCHSTLTQTAGKDLQDRDSARIALASRDIELVGLLRGTVPKKYRMPPDQPLPEADIVLIKRWHDAVTDDAGPTYDASPPDDAGPIDDASPTDDAPLAP